MNFKRVFGVVCLVVVFVSQCVVGAATVTVEEANNMANQIVNTPALAALSKGVANQIVTNADADGPQATFLNGNTLAGLLANPIADAIGTDVAASTAIARGIAADDGAYGALLTPRVLGAIVTAIGNDAGLSGTISDGINSTLKKYFAIALGITTGYGVLLTFWVLLNVYPKLFGQSRGAEKHARTGAGSVGDKAAQAEKVPAGAQAKGVGKSLFRTWMVAGLLVAAVIVVLVLAYTYMA